MSNNAITAVTDPAASRDNNYMLTSEKTAAVGKAVEDQIAEVLAAGAFIQWNEQNRLRPGDLLVINNSLLNREGASAVKNAKYLCLKTNATGAPCLPPFVGRPGVVRGRFKRISHTSIDTVSLESLDQAATRELESMGLIIRALVGRIGYDEGATVEIEKVAEVSTIRYDPNQRQLVQFQAGNLSINRVDDINLVWTAVANALSAAQLDGDALAPTFEKKFSELREMACRPVDISIVDSDGPSILGEVHDRVGRQISAYRHALTYYIGNKGDAESFNELLRIAYNFADGAQELMRLAVGVSDMKPLLLWMTIGAQSRFVDELQGLPLGIVGDVKPSINKYRQAVAGARNRAFHDIFAFDQPFRVRLTGDAFQTPELRLFRRYSSKDPALNYDDRNLVVLLEGFTRTSEQTVPLGFWESNLKVMEAVEGVVKALRIALMTIFDSADDAQPRHSR